jgi:hypothetical protein
MLDAINSLLESDVITDETREAISEAWDAKLNEAKEQVRSEIREEFAQKYEHDKTNMVEALDKMITDNLSEEIVSLQEEKTALAEDRVKFQTKMKESSTKFNDFMVSKLAEEIGELRKDRQTHNNGFKKLEKFVVKALSEEINEFAQDKQDVVKTKIRLVREAKGKLTNLKNKFVTESAKKLTASVSSHLKTELSQLHEDIRVARENSFGRKIFEAYASEYGATHLNTNAEIRELNRVVENKNQQLSQATKVVRKAKAIAESKGQEVKMIKESNLRSSTLQELLGPLNAEKRSIMKDLLESVQTSRLKNAYEKYLPAVLAEGKRSVGRSTLSEGLVEVTGDKKSTPAPKINEDSNNDNVIDIKRLAGI